MSGRGIGFHREQAGLVQGSGFTLLDTVSFSMECCFIDLVETIGSSNSITILYYGECDYLDYISTPDRSLVKGLIEELSEYDYRGSYSFFYSVDGLNINKKTHCFSGANNTNIKIIIRYDDNR